jgi:hypothetical protein
MSLSVNEQERALREAIVAWDLRNNQGASTEQIAERFGYGSVEALHRQFQNWGLPSWVVGEGADTNPTPKSKGGKTSSPRLRNLGTGTELPPAGNATELFKERLEVLLKSAELLKHMDESLHGRYFVRQDVESVSLLLSRHLMSEEHWSALSEHHGFDPDEERFWKPNAVAKFPGGVTVSPSETEAIHIGVHALADGDMDTLLATLHLDPSSVGTKAREEIRQYVEGSRSNGDKRDGLKTLARQLAIWVRGSEVRQGRPPNLSRADHEFACRVTRLRRQGLTDEEIARKESHWKKEDGTSYTVKDVTELGDMDLSWP